MRGPVEIIYEKNADAQRPAASTQKLLTALIVAERGYLDHQVVVEPVDTQAEPVKLNIKTGRHLSTDRSVARVAGEKSE